MIPPGYKVRMRDGSAVVQGSEGEAFLAGRLEVGIELSDGSSAWLRPSRPGLAWRTGNVDQLRHYTLSRFVFFRSELGRRVIESATSPFIVEFESWIPAAVLSEFSGPASVKALCDHHPTIHQDIPPVAGLLWRAGFLDEGHSGGPSVQDLWGFHELLFHDRSSTPRLGAPFGGMKPLRPPVTPAIKPPMSSVFVPLRVPDMKRLMREDAPFTSVLESRRSAGVPGATPLKLERLGEFLFRVAHYQESGRRPLPGAGGRHALEFYVAPHACEGLSSTLYHYQAIEHRLCQIAPQPAAVLEMLRLAGMSWGRGGYYPRALLVLTARFGRMADRYAAIAYRNLLLDAGIAIQTMYLVATSMNLGVCALGLNVPELFAAATGIDRAEETPVALMALSEGLAHE